MVGAKYKEVDESTFEIGVRYMGSSLIVTVPMRVKRKLGLKPGDRVVINIRKKMEAYIASGREK